MAEKQRILIVDDDENIAELISLYLMKECYETYIVNDGEEALKIFPEFKPNLILLDLMLPGIDGYRGIAQTRCFQYRNRRNPKHHGCHRTTLPTKQRPSIPAIQIRTWYAWLIGQFFPLRNELVPVEESPIQLG